jgi:hypothetical protein
MIKPRGTILLACTIPGNVSGWHYLHLKQDLLIFSSGNWTVYLDNTIEIHLNYIFGLVPCVRTLPYSHLASTSQCWLARSVTACCYSC